MAQQRNEEKNQRLVTKMRAEMEVMMEERELGLEEIMH